eukprot:scaffold72627_cov54-Attheya_sp.AAC.4
MVTENENTVLPNSPPGFLGLFLSLLTSSRAMQSPSCLPSSDVSVTSLMAEFTTTESPLVVGSAVSEAIGSDGGVGFCVCDVVQGGHCEVKSHSRKAAGAVQGNCLFVRSPDKSKVADAAYVLPSIK